MLRHVFFFFPIVHTESTLGGIVVILGCSWINNLKAKDSIFVFFAGMVSEGNQNSFRSTFVKIPSLEFGLKK